MPWGKILPELICRERNLTTFTTFPSSDDLISDLSRHLIPATFIFYSPLFLRDFSFWVTQNIFNLSLSTEDFERLKYSEFETRQELFQTDFSCFQHFATLSSCGILISVRHRCFFVSFTKFLKTIGDFS